MFANLDGAVVIDSRNWVWTLESWISVFTGWIQFDTHFITNGVDVRFSGAVLRAVVLDDATLFPIANVVPISLERDVEEFVASEHELCRRCLGGSVNGGVHCISD